MLFHRQSEVFYIYCVFKYLYVLGTCVCLSMLEAVNETKSAGRTENGFFEGEQMSIAFNVNENLSISYTEAEETYDAQDNAATAVADVVQKTDAIQIAYSMGAMSIKAYRMDSENPGWDDDAADMTETEIALGLSF